MGIVAIGHIDAKVYQNRSSSVICLQGRVSSRYDFAQVKPT